MGLHLLNLGTAVPARSINQRTSVAWSELPCEKDLRGEAWSLRMEIGSGKEKRSVRVPMLPGSAYISWAPRRAARARASAHSRTNARSRVCARARARAQRACAQTSVRTRARTRARNVARAKT